MNKLLTLTAALLMLSTAANAQNVFVSPKDDTTTSPQSSPSLAFPPANDSALEPVQEATAPLTTTEPAPTTESARQQNPIVQGSGRLDIVPGLSVEEQARYREMSDVLAAQNPELKVNGFTISDDVKILLDESKKLQAYISNVCDTKTLSVIIMHPSFFNVHNAAKNFTKVGSPFIAEMLASQCRSDDDRRDFKKVVLLLNIENDPTAKVPSISVKGNGLIFKDDFSKDTPPSMTMLLSDLRRQIDAERRVPPPTVINPEKQVY
jgi:hypothetical protein